ncbi:MAG: transglycosylase SLT domain-containing protein [Deltaproteobacteria bacterium]|nr:transglycosylase SLT domain-containing protein [Deltaproteobacteria bacterium]
MISIVRIFVFLLPPAWFLSGCISPVLHLSHWTQLASPPDNKIQPRTPVEKARPEPAIDSALLALLQQSDAEERGLFTPESFKEEEKAQTKKEVQEKSTKSRLEPPTVLQETPGPKADDQLLDLWQRDLDQAMQQPAGRRKIQFSMPVVENDRVRYFVNFFCSKTRDFFERSLARSGRYVPMMAAILREEGLPEDLVYLSLIESGFSPYAYSRAKAVGPWQFIRSTGLRYGLKINGWVDERRDPLKSTRAAAAYLKDLHLQFGEWFLAAAAYNAGEGKVEKAMNRSRTTDFWHLSQKTFLKRETRNYVPKFIAAALIASEPEKYGFGDILYEPPLEYDEVTIKGPLRLQTIADLSNTTVERIKELNPALLRNHTPPSKEAFLMRVPAGMGEIFAQAYGLLPKSAKVRTITHKVRKGETLTGIAKSYRQRVSRLMEMNNLKSHRLQVGQELIVVFDGAMKKR